MAPPSLKLHLIPGSSSMFPHILLRYCELPFTPIPVKIASVQSTSFCNAKQQVPVLILDDKELITENPAIALAISQLAPEKQLFGSTPLGHVRISERLAWIAGPLHAQAWGPYIRPFRLTTDQSEEALAAVKECARVKCEERYKTLEEGLHEMGPWAMGEKFTAVDAYVFPFYMLATRLMGLDARELYPRWTRVVDNLMELDCVKEMLRFEAEADQKP